jgi:single-stranded DNA-specific DHH superfamily exonuclease
LAEYIDQLNKDRDTLDRRILKSANKLIKENHDPSLEPALVLSQPDWHLGVIGIAAGRIAQAHHRPTIMISTDPLGNRPGVGSCRTSCGVDLYQALEGSQAHLISFGGHTAAARINIDTAVRELETGGYTIIADAGVMCVVEKGGLELQLFSSGRVLVKTPELEVAEKGASALFECLGEALKG